MYDVYCAFFSILLKKKRKNYNRVKRIHYFGNIKDQCFLKVVILILLIKSGLRLNQRSVLYSGKGRTVEIETEMIYPASLVCGILTCFSLYHRSISNEIVTDVNCLQINSRSIIRNISTQAFVFILKN